MSLIKKSIFSLINILVYSVSFIHFILAGYIILWAENKDSFYLNAFERQIFYGKSAIVTLLILSGILILGFAVIVSNTTTIANTNAKVLSENRKHFKDMQKSVNETRILVDKIILLQTIKRKEE